MKMYFCWWKDIGTANTTVDYPILIEENVKFQLDIIKNQDAGFFPVQVHGTFNSYCILAHGA